MCGFLIKRFGVFVNGVGVCVIAVWGLHLFGLVASAVRPSNCAYHGFWISGSPGAMILDKACFFENPQVFCKFVCVCVCFKYWVVFVKWVLAFV